MNENNVVQFPNMMKDAIDDEQWRTLQGEFYLDCYYAMNGKPADSPDELKTWLEEAKIFADTENPFFRGWLIRRLSEPKS